MALKQVIDVGGQGEAPRSRDIAGSGSAYAKDTNFDPTNTDFESTQLQALGEEIDGALSTKASKTNLSNYILTGTKPSTALTSGTFFVDKDGALRVATDDIATTDDVGSGNSAVKSVGEVLSELNNTQIKIIGMVAYNAPKTITIPIKCAGILMFYGIMTGQIGEYRYNVGSSVSNFGDKTTITMTEASISRSGNVLTIANNTSVSLLHVYNLPLTGGYLSIS